MKNGAPSPAADVGAELASAQAGEQASCSPTTPTRRQLLVGATGVAATTILGPFARATANPSRTRPNLLFFLPDQHRADWIASERHAPVPTPNLDALIRRGAHFTRTLCASPLCAPSRACLVTGREYDRCGVRDNEQDLPAGSPTFFRRLRDGGYHVMGVGKVDLGKGSRNWGVDGRRHLEQWGFSDLVDCAGKIEGPLAYYGVRSSADPRPRPGEENKSPKPEEPYLTYLDALDPPRAREFAEDMMARVRGRKPEIAYGDTRPSPLDDPHYLDNWIGRRGLEQIEAAPRDRPWFQIVNFAGPHSPTDVTRRMDALYRGPDRVIDAFPQPHAYTGAIQPAMHTAIRQSYAAMIENIDRWLGIYLDALARRGELDSTIVVWASDHGEMLGDHGQWDKQVPHRSSTAVPLVIAGPGVAPGRRERALVSLIDLNPTFLELAGLDPMCDTDARSIAPLFGAEGRSRSHREHVLSGLLDWCMVWDGRYKLVCGWGPQTTFSKAFGPGPQLFDLEEDPWEDHNIAEFNPTLVKRLTGLLQPSCCATGRIIID
jgi:arylsulfatase A-like enzyme